MTRFVLLLTGCAVPPAAALLLLAPPLPPAPPVPPTSHAGFLLGSPVGITSALDPTIRIKCAGFDDLCMDQEVEPDFTQIPSCWLEDVWPGTGPSPILAMSLGIDALPVYEATVGDADSGDPSIPKGTKVAVMAPQTNGWVALEFTVDTAAVSDGLAPDVEDALNTGELGQTVFSFFIPGSAGETLPPETRSVRAMRPEALGLDAGSGDIDGLNLHMAMYRTDLSAHAHFFTHPLPALPTLYFTLSPVFAKAMANDQALVQLFGNSLNAATIFTSSWTGSGWTPPAVHRRPADLGLTADAVIDGLAIAAASPETGENLERILFSTRDAPVASQLQFIALDTAVAPPPPSPVFPVVVRESGGKLVPLATRLQAGRNIGDFCTADPMARNRFVAHVLDDFLIARRLPHLDIPDSTLRLAVASYRQWLPGSRRRIGVRSCMSCPGGSVLSGKATVRWGVMHGYFNVGPIHWLGSRSIPYHGEPLAADLPLPDRDLRGDRAFVVQWILRAPGGLLVSPLSALRF